MRLSRERTMSPSGRKSSNRWAGRLSWAVARLLVRGVKQDGSRNGQRNHSATNTAILVGLATCTFGLTPAVAQPNPPVIFLHYDYMVLEQADGFSPPHSDAPHQESIDTVVAAFRRRGIQLIIDPQHTVIPHQHVFAECGGLEMARLRNTYFHPQGNQPWHYAVFGHRGTLCGSLRSGFANLPGFNFMVTLGGAFHEPPFSFCDEFSLDLCRTIEAGTFMHELGHNLDLHHGGDQEDDFKPNYFSVMNNNFIFIGVPFAAVPGSTTIVGYSEDYSDFALPGLDENHLDEHKGLGGPPNSTYVSIYLCPYDASCPPGAYWIPSTGLRTRRAD
jgi:hypothetical protein